MRFISHYPKGMGNTGVTVKKYSILLLALLLSSCGSSSDSSSLAFESKAALGESLFNDTNLSFNRTQSCASCHDADKAFTDSREDDNGLTAAVSLGDDDVSLGDRNAPTVLYASLSPEFQEGTRSRFNSSQSDYSGWLGGQFHDGRSSTLADQAGGPPLNPIEMGMADRASVVERLLENEDYIAAFESLYGTDVFDDTDTAYEAMTDAIATFEATDVFAPFDSKYDRSQLSSNDEDYYDYGVLSKVASGKVLFFSQQFTNCATCHQLKSQGYSGETFTGYEYHNIGVPVNTAVRLANGSDDDFIDTGLQLNNSAVTADTEAGKFKVPTLRNVAITAPYMHNGVFNELATVVKFYDHWLTGSRYTINPETGVEWAEPEISETISLTELQDGSLFDDDDVEALVCFMMTLTDARYESLISDAEWENCETE
ncbi:cytochrome c peroxidase [Oceanobacter sp. 5_MG-2023]|uniref:cytochrome-c peroxidase n=1 Tax=Oceanobacter sp. 5_MG-2023 TaxID=3062645 RepID=UPI0026E39080|nr:cytochrome c peroxidase [Oceanobacter sp. 5_MG-2023]MDO6681898.1 cytochrome c peroxidase [Oceanobacter sp. 5_MG-2023]